MTKINQKLTRGGGARLLNSFANRRKILYLGTVIILAVFVVFFSFSQAFMKKRIDGRLVTVKVGELSYDLESEKLTNNQIILAANSSEIVDLKVTSLNPIDSRYEIYYKIISPDNITNQLEGGYVRDSEALPLGNIEKETSKNMKLVLNNTGNEEVTIEIGIKAGLVHNDLALDIGENTFSKEIYQKFYVYDYTEDYQTFIAPVNGMYQVELWGAGGVQVYRPAASGGGAYTSGVLNLVKDEELYVYLGAVGQNFNFGVQSYLANSGGASDVRLVDGTWSDTVSLASRIMVAAGNGGEGGLNAWNSGDPYPGVAGGLTGYAGGNIDLGYGGAGATQTAGGGFGYSSGANTGGNGYYSGYRGFEQNGVAGGGGGSSFISGHTGCVAIASSSNITARTGTEGRECTTGTTDNLCSIHYSNKQFLDTVMIDGLGYRWTNEVQGQVQMPMLSGGYYDFGFGHAGDGQARITLISNLEDNGYTLESEKLNNQLLIIGPNDSENFELILTNDNQESSSYQLYYEVLTPYNTTNIIEGGYILTGENPTQGLMDANESKSMNLVINNIGNDSVIIKIGVKISDNLNGIQLVEGENSFRQEVVQKYFIYDYTGNYQTFVASVPGTYQIELWGAQGGGTAGGKGAYVSGYIDLFEQETLYLYLGESGENYDHEIFNNGNMSKYISYAGISGYMYSGGGATDIRLVAGEWNDFSSLKSRIMVASAGGGAQTYYASLAGGNGGSLNGYTGNISGSDGRLATGATQTSGGLNGLGTNSAKIDQAGFGINTVFSGDAGAGGGSGYYAGGTGAHGGGTVGSGAGGSSFISGYEGCDAIREDSTSSAIVHTGQANHYSGKIFSNSVMKAGNEEMPTHDLTSTMTGNSGNGYARITLVNSEFYTVVYDANGGEGVMEDSKFGVDFESTLKTNEFTKEGYSFQG